MNSYFEDEEHQLLCAWLAVIGFIVTTWSSVEISIDQSIHLIGHWSKEKGKGKPTRLNGKLDFIKKNMPEEIINDSKLEYLTSATKKVSQVRDVCVHGIIETFDQQEMQMSKVQGRSAEHSSEIFTFNKKHLDLTAKNLFALSTEWSVLVTNILKWKDKG